MKKIISIFAASAILLGLVGCSGETLKTRNLAAWSKADPEKENLEELKVTYEEFEKEYLFSLDYNQIDPTSENDEKAREQYRKSVVENLVNEKILLYIAKENGIEPSTLSQEVLTKIDETVQGGLQSWYDAFNTDALNELGPGATEDEIDARSKELFQKYLKGFNLTEEDFYVWETNTQIKQLLYDKLLADTTVTEEEIETMYQNILKEAKTAYEETPDMYEEYPEYQIFFVPEGARVIKHILVMIDADDIQEIYELKQSGENEEADELLKEKLEELKPKANEILQELKDGGDFDTLMKEHSEDTGLERNPNGYVVIPNSKQWVKPFYDTSMELEKIEDISDLVTSDYGYHIIQYTDDKVLSDEDYKEAMKISEGMALNQKKSAAAMEMFEEWEDRFQMELNYDKLKLTKPEETTETTTTK